MTVESIQPFLEPVRRSVTVPGLPVETFDRFTSRFGEWWPLAPPYAVFGEDTRTCGLEPRLGGELFETSASGERCVWGRIQVWEPPHRVAFSWHPGRDPDSFQIVEVTFTATGRSTRVDLEHRDWQRMGDRAAEVRSRYESGWTVVLGRFADFVVVCAAAGTSPPG